VNITRPPVECGVILDDRHDRLGCVLVRDARILAFPSAFPPTWALEALTLVTIHEFVHLTLADAGEDYYSEPFARYAEKKIYDWLHGSVEYEMLVNEILEHYQRRI